MKLTNKIINCSEKRDKHITAKGDFRTVYIYFCPHVPLNSAEMTYIQL